MRPAGRLHAGLYVALLPVCLAGCDNRQSMLFAHGPGSAEILRLFWIFLAVSAVVWVPIAIALLWIAVRPCRREEEDEPLRLQPTRERRATFAVGALVGTTALILVGLTLASYLGGKRLAALAGTDAVTVRLTAQQWWWEVRYEDGDPTKNFYTANEIRVPVGEPVRVKLEARDVIHSFWVPSLSGKEDLIPGRANEIVVRADRPGVYRGQCAEFCGYQHAHMALTFVAEPRPDWERWRTAQLQAASAPTEPAPQRGQSVFLTKGCAMCHSVQGTPAGARSGPDLTHAASRLTIAAGTLPMTPENLLAWIADPQRLKPGSKMPRLDLTDEELRAVTSYVAGLR
jgi:cytochrome c oxidase subunit 2